MIKRIATLAAAILVATAAWAQATITFAETRRDMGIIKEADGKVTVEYPFTNTGDQPLSIATAYGTCDCAKIKYPTKPVAPGASGKITITYNPKHRKGEVLATITVVSNDPASKRTKLLLKGTVLPQK